MPRALSSATSGDWNIMTSYCGLYMATQKTHNNLANGALPFSRRQKEKRITVTAADIHDLAEKGNSLAGYLLIALCRPALL